MKNGTVLTTNLKSKPVTSSKMAWSQGQRTQDLMLPDGGPSAQEMNTIKGSTFCLICGQ